MRRFRMRVVNLSILSLSVHVYPWYIVFVQCNSCAFLGLPLEKVKYGLRPTYLVNTTVLSFHDTKMILLTSECIDATYSYPSA
jgi:hypothetical protein